MFVKAFWHILKDGINVFIPTVAWLVMTSVPYLRPTLHEDKIVIAREIGYDRRFHANEIIKMHMNLQWNYYLHGLRNPQYWLFASCSPGIWLWRHNLTLHWFTNQGAHMIWPKQLRLTEVAGFCTQNCHCWTITISSGY